MKQGNKKLVCLIAHAFDCLPGHDSVSGYGRASTTRVAAMRAMENIFASPLLKGRRVRSFRATITIAEGEKADATKV
jgi:hypothetical protein